MVAITQISEENFAQNVSKSAGAMAMSPEEVWGVTLHLEPVIG